MVADPETTTHGQLLQVVDNELSTRGLHDSPSGRGGVVRSTLSEGDSLGHFVLVLVSAKENDHEVSWAVSQNRVALFLGAGSLRVFVSARAFLV